jgi:hypothetical protein
MAQGATAKAIWAHLCATSTNILARQGVQVAACLACTGRVLCVSSQPASRWLPVTGSQTAAGAQPTGGGLHCKASKQILRVHEVSSLAS